MKKDATAVPRLNAINRQQLVLRTLDVEKLIDDDHSARLIWEPVGRLDLSLYHSQIAAVEGQPGKTGQPDLRDYFRQQTSISSWQALRIVQKTTQFRLSPFSVQAVPFFSWINRVFNRRLPTRSIKKAGIEFGHKLRLAE